MIYDYSNLRTRIKELYGTQKAFALALGWTPGKLARRLGNRSQWAADEIIAAANLLSIPQAEYDKYFFALPAIQPDTGLHFSDIEDLCRQMLTSVGIKIVPYSALDPTHRQTCYMVSDYGFYTFKKQELFLNDQQPKDERIKTLLHELGHIVMRCRDDERGEQLADRFMGDFYRIMTCLAVYQQGRQQAASLHKKPKNRV